MKKRKERDKNAFYSWWGTFFPPVLWLWLSLLLLSSLSSFAILNIRLETCTRKRRCMYSEHYLIPRGCDAWTRFYSQNQYNFMLYHHACRAIAPNTRMQMTKKALKTILWTFSHFFWSMAKKNANFLTTMSNRSLNSALSNAQMDTVSFVVLFWFFFNENGNCARFSRPSHKSFFVFWPTKSKNKMKLN